MLDMGERDTNLVKSADNESSSRREEDFDEQWYHAQKMESLGVLAGGMAHDMNNVLASIMAVASAMDAEMSSKHPYADDVKDILNACKRGSRLTRGLLGFARRHRTHAMVVSVNDAVAEVTGILRRTLPKGIELSSRLDEALEPVYVDPDQFNQVLMNVCLNAVDAMGEQGCLTVKTTSCVLTRDQVRQHSDALAGKYSRIVVSDTGPGIPGDIQKKVFEPFFSTKPKGQGTGLGLAMAYGVIKKHRGIIWIDDKYQAGARIVIDLPVSVEEGTHVCLPSEIDAINPVRGKGTILLVDDEDLFRASSKRILEKLGYDVICCANGREALKAYDHYEQQIDVVILDIVMPVMGGRETYYGLREKGCRSPVLIASGISEEDNIQDLFRDGVAGFLGKPFDLQSLSDTLSRMGRSASAV